MQEIIMPVTIGLVFGLLIGYLIWNKKKNLTATSKSDQVIYKELLVNDKAFQLTKPITMDEKDIKKLHQYYVDYTSAIDNNQEFKYHQFSNFVTFPKDLFITMGEYFKSESGKNMYGVRCTFIQYDRFYKSNAGEIKFKIPGKKKDDQTSIVFLPVDANKKVDYNAWGSNSPFLVKVDPGGYNHGEVCPTICSGEDY